jgi:hypothetical protein
MDAVLFSKKRQPSPQAGCPHQLIGDIAKGGLEWWPESC